MLYDRVPIGLGVVIGLRVDHAITAQGGIGFQLGSDPFSGSLVGGAARPFSAPTGVVEPRDHVRALPVSFVNAGHVITCKIVLWPAGLWNSIRTDHDVMDLSSPGQS